MFTDASAKKLQSLPGSKGPLWTILQCMIFHAVEKPVDVDMVVNTFGTLQGECMYSDSVLHSNVYQLNLLHMPLWMCTRLPR